MIFATVELQSAAGEAYRLAALVCFTNVMPHRMHRTDAAYCHVRRTSCVLRGIYCVGHR